MDSKQIVNSRSHPLHMWRYHISSSPHTWRYYMSSYPTFVVVPYVIISTYVAVPYVIIPHICGGTICHYPPRSHCPKTREEGACFARNISEENYAASAIGSYYIDDHAPEGHWDKPDWDISAKDKMDQDMVNREKPDWDMANWDIPHQDMADREMPDCYTLDRKIPDQDMADRDMPD